jgi:prepilin peptidase CpaA
MNFFWLAAFAAALGILSVTDVRYRKLPNVGVAVLAAMGAAKAFAIGGISELGLSLAGAAAGFGLLYFQYSRGWMGAGDVKLLAAVGAWVGPVGAVWVWLVGSVLGGVLSVISLVRLQPTERVQVKRNLTLFALTRGADVPPPSQLSHARGIPFGVALCVAALGVYFAHGGAL